MHQSAKSYNILHLIFKKTPKSTIAAIVENLCYFKLSLIAKPLVAVSVKNSSPTVHTYDFSRTFVTVSYLLL